MAYWDKKQKARFSDSSVHVKDDGTVVHHQYEYVGYGRHCYNFVGTLEGVTAAVEDVKRSYPPAGYGTSFNWPPGRTYQFPVTSAGKLIEYEQPVEIAPGIWHLWGSHSNSSD